MLPKANHVSVSSFTRHAVEYCAWTCTDPPLAPLTVTPAAPWIVGCPVPFYKKQIVAPAGKATDALGGTVTVMAAALSSVTSLD